MEVKGGGFENHIYTSFGKRVQGLPEGLDVDGK
jgi:hypothetical protein